MNEAFDLELKGKALLVEIPWDIETLKQRDLSLAQHWRLDARQIFTHYFKCGYLVSESFAEHGHGGHMPRSYYLLERISREEVLK